MNRQVLESVVSFLDTLFVSVFFAPIRDQLEDPLIFRHVQRQLSECSDAASPTLERLFSGFGLSDRDVAEILNGLACLKDRVDEEEISNPNLNLDTVAAALQLSVPCPRQVIQSDNQPLFALTIRAIAGLLMLVAPIFREWQKTQFSRAYQAPSRITDRLLRSSELLGWPDLWTKQGEDERFDLFYRDYLLQRFATLPGGLFRMASKVEVDLQEVFVEPCVLEIQKELTQGTSDPREGRPATVAAARRQLEGTELARNDATEDPSATAFVCAHRRALLVGPPGAGKSTLLEWLQLQVATGATLQDDTGVTLIPLLLRVRELHTSSLPTGDDLVGAATSSDDVRRLVPDGWLSRRSTSGRLLVMVDGLDEADPRTRDDLLLPWLATLLRSHPKSRVLVSSRAVDLPLEWFYEQGFRVGKMAPFSRQQIEEFISNWQVAVRLARREREEEARRSGKRDGKRLARSLLANPSMSTLCTNPLMLSVVCVLQDFEQGNWPDDVARLYELCVEGLLHHWDQSRGIQSGFSFEEKLSAVREIALAMQADDLAEYTEHNVLAILETLWPVPGKGMAMLEHIKRRTGLLLEQRTGSYVFAHLAFQEYLASRAIRDGNQRSLTDTDLARQHAEPRWYEVIPLYGRIVTGNQWNRFLDALLTADDTGMLATMLASVYRTIHESPSPKRIQQVVTRVVSAPQNRSGVGPASALDAFPIETVAAIANDCVGLAGPTDALSEGFAWLSMNPRHLDRPRALHRLLQGAMLPSLRLTELNYLVHQHGTQRDLTRTSRLASIYTAKTGLDAVANVVDYHSQAEVALEALSLRRTRRLDGQWPAGTALAVESILRHLGSRADSIEDMSFWQLERLIETYGVDAIPSASNLQELGAAVKALAGHKKGSRRFEALHQWASSIAQHLAQQG